MTLKDNKSTRILLGIALLGIWGTVIYRVYQSMQGNEIPTTTFNLQDWTTPNTEANSTFQLALDYNDPFLKKGGTQIVNNEPITTTISTPSPAVNLEAVLPKAKPKNVTFPNIRYIGYVQNTGSLQKSVLLKVNGKKYKRQLGGMIDKMHITMVTKDSVQVYLDGGSKMIYRGK